MNYEEFEKLVTARQACRNFNDREITEEEIVKIVELARFCPSACNSQPWKLYYTVEKEKLDRITACLQDGGMNKFLCGAKGYIVVAGKGATLKAGSEKMFSQDHFVKYDVGEMVAYITLIAKSMGIDSCIIGWVNGKNIATALSLPENEFSDIVVALGYSDAETRKKVRVPLEVMSEKL